MIKLEKILLDAYGCETKEELEIYYDISVKTITNAMRVACEQAIDLCSENAVTKYSFVSTGDYSGFDKWIIDKNSILDLKQQII